MIGVNDPYTVRQACIAMEQMDLSPLVPQIERPLLMTNGTYDILCPPELAPSGLGARKMAELNANITTHEFPDIGHADLLECPDDAVRIVSAFFHDALARPANRPRPGSPARTSAATVAFTGAWSPSRGSRARGIAPLIASISHRRPASRSSSIDGRAPRIRSPKAAHVLHRVVEAERDPDRDGDVVRLGGAALGDRPRVVVVEHLLRS